MIATPDAGRVAWRVGYHADPVGFAPLELYEFSHRFDDIGRRFRTLYASQPEPGDMAGRERLALWACDSAA